MSPAEILELPRRAFCFWVSESTRTCAIVHTTNAFGYYLRSLNDIKNGDFKYMEATEEFRVEADPNLLFKPLILKLHQGLHDEWVAKGYKVISKRPEQNLELILLPASIGWILTLQTGSSKYVYDQYTKIKEVNEIGKKVTVEEALIELNRRANVE